MRLLRLGIFVWVICLSCGLVACLPPGERDPFAYVQSGFSADLRGSFTRLGPPCAVGESSVGVPQPFSATVEMGPAGGTESRPVRITFSEPAALSGVTAERFSSGDVTITFPGGVILTDTAGTYEALFRFADALLPAGDVTALTPAVDGIRTVTRTASDGRQSVDYVFSEGDTLPRRVTVVTPEERLDMAVEVSDRSKNPQGPVCAGNLGDSEPVPLFQRDMSSLSPTI